MKITKKLWLATIIFSLFGQIAWTMENMFFNVFIESQFNATGNQIALMVSLSAIVATLTTLFMGALSDKLGKRKGFICGGYILWGISILCFAFLNKDVLGNLFPYANAMQLGVTLVILFDCIMTFFGSTANDAAFNSWITDITTKDNRGRFEGVIGAMPLVSILVVFGLFSGLTDKGLWDVVFIIIGVLVIIAGIIGFFIIKDAPINAKKDEPYFKNIFYGFRPSVIKNNSLLYIIFIAFAIFGISTQVFMPYYIIYLQKGLQMADYVLIMAPAIILAAVFTVFYGKYLDKHKFKKSLVPVFIIYIVGLMTLFIFKDTILVFLGCLFMMCGYLAIGAAFGATIRDYTPKENVGLFQGIRMFVQVLIPMIIGPWIGSSVSGDNSTLIGGVVQAGFIPTNAIFLAAAIVALITIIPLVFIYKKMKPIKIDLMTPYVDDLDENNVHQEYPRPFLKRDSYLNLNGIWNYAISKQDIAPLNYDGEILVPFPLESTLSKVKKTLKKGEYLYYYKTFTLPKDFIKEEVYLHFQAVDQIATVYLNGVELGSHEGGYLPFSFEIKSHLKETNELIVKVKDELDKTYPYGKQTHNPKGMWYTEVTGIWQTVWIESVAKNHIKNIKLTPNVDEESITIKLDANNDEKDYQIYFEGNLVTNLKTTENLVTIKIPNAKTWDANNPYLYDLKITSKEDEITSYFALRKLHIEGNKIYLNNKEVFFNGVLDQGYFPDGIFLPATYKAYEDDIKLMKSMGFNTLRKHIKIEPMIFYYLCDKLGMYVFQDMVNNGPYSFFFDTALPTVGFKKKDDTKKPLSEFFKKHTIETINYLYNVPSIVYYTIYNEGWGQRHSDKMYEIVKEIDNTRIIDSTSGWFHCEKSDVFSPHVYFKDIVYTPISKPTIVSEFGGFSFKDLNHCTNLTYTYGYTDYVDNKAYEDSVLKLYKEQVLPHVGNGLCGAIYTQLSDVEDETNGFITYDRKVVKVNPENFYNLFKDIK